MNTEIIIGLNLFGLILGVGSSFLILILGFLSLFSPYWFRTLNGVDKISIPLLWIGSVLLLISYTHNADKEILTAVPTSLKYLLTVIKILNGIYLTFFFAPVIRKFEFDNKTTFLKLPKPHQYLIFLGGIIAGTVWFSESFIFIYEVTEAIR